MNKVWINTAETYVQSIKSIVRQDWWQGFSFVPIRILLERLIPYQTTDSIWDTVQTVQQLCQQFHPWQPEAHSQRKRPGGRNTPILEEHQSQMGVPSQRQFMRGTGFFVVVGAFLWFGGWFFFKVRTRKKKKVNWNLFNERQYTELWNRDCTNLHHGLILSGSVTHTVNQEYY